MCYHLYLTIPPTVINSSPQAIAIPYHVSLFVTLAKLSSQIINDTVHGSSSYMLNYFVGTLLVSGMIVLNMNVIV